MNTTQSITERIYFQWFDHLLFTILLLASIAIGLYFSLIAKKSKQTVDEYYLGNKKMFVFPVAMSLTASHVSSITLTAVPADVYQYGSSYALSIVSILFVSFVYTFVYLPVFHQLQLKSTYEYLSLRFNTATRKACSCLFYLNYTLYISIVVYVPSLAYSQATGINLYLVIPVICSICIFYTTIGGIKAVVWTDTLQFTLTMGAILIVFVLGLIRIGGLSNLFRVAEQGERLALDWSFNLTAREAAFAVFMHWTLFYLRMTTSQECVLKFLSLPTLKKAQQAMFLFGFGIIAVKALVVLIGLILFARYKDCDPYTAGLITKYDQLVPFYVSDIASGIPGLTGLFISGVLCTGLSSLSAALNSASASVYQDFLVDYFPEENHSIRTAFIMKLLVVLIGIQVAAVAMLVTQLGPILPLAISISGVAAGSFVGLFSLGMLCPGANSKGALAGILGTTFIVGWMFIGAQWYKKQGYLRTLTKHLSTERCFVNSTQFDRTAMNGVITEEPPIFYLYKISVSYVTQGPGEVPDELLSPVVHYIRGRKGGRSKTDYTSIAIANEHIGTRKEECETDLSSL